MRIELGKRYPGTDKEVTYLLLQDRVTGEFLYARHRLQGGMLQIPLNSAAGHPFYEEAVATAQVHASTRSYSSRVGNAGSPIAQNGDRLLRQSMAPKMTEENMTHLDFRCQVLLVEDNPINTELVKAVLAAVNCELTTVEDGIQAIEAFKARAFHIVFLDFHLPKMNGGMVAKAMRVIESSRMTRPAWIAALTGSALPADIQSCLDAGMNEVLSKPFDVMRLRKIVTNLESCRGGQPSV